MKMNLIGKIFLLFLVLHISGFAEELKPYKLINSDKLIVNKFDEEYVTDLKGNVHFFYGETEFFADAAQIFEEKKITKLIGNVKVFEDTLSLFADRAEYFRLSEKMILDKNVFIKEVHTDSTFRTFESEHTEYFFDSQELTVTDDVHMFDERENMSGSCGKLIYNADTGYGYLMQSPLLTKHGADSLTVTGEKIEYFRDFEKVTANFDVRTYNKDFLITSDFMIIFNKENKAFFLGEPLFTNETAVASANEFHLFFDEENITKAEMTDDCRIDFKSKETNEEMKNWVTSELAEFFFEEGNITKCVATGIAESYFEQTEDDKNSRNRSSGNVLILNIEDSDINSISMQNNVKGTYVFEK